MPRKHQKSGGFTGRKTRRSHRVPKHTVNGKKRIPRAMRNFVVGKLVDRTPGLKSVLSAIQHCQSPL